MDDLKLSDEIAFITLEATYDPQGEIRIRQNNQLLQVIRTQDLLIKEVLIRLGWTSPSKSAVEEQAQ